MRTILVDVDGTLADNTHREHHLNETPPNWGAFNSKMAHDTPLPNIVQLVQHLYESNRIIICTGREECDRNTTEQWLHRHGVRHHRLMMRPLKDYRADAIIKSEMLDRLLVEDHDIWFVLDDRNSVVEMWRARGLTCLQCAPGDF